MSRAPTVILTARKAAAYKRSARELWKFCAIQPESVARAIEDARNRGEEIDWWAAGEPRRRRVDEG